MLDKHITRLVKGDDGTVQLRDDRPPRTIKLAARAGHFDLHEFGVDDERIAALGRHTQLAIAAGIDALRDAGIPLVHRYKTTTTGTKLPDRWSLPEQLRDDTGVIFASAFPGLEEMADEAQRFTTDHMRRERMAALQSLRARMLDHGGTDPVVLAEVERRIDDLQHQLDTEPYEFDRRFIFRILSMGHSQFAELIGARGPNTQINSACASTTQAIALAEDWIRAGRCRRVVIVAADDATSDTLMGWIGAGFLASGAAATDEVVEEAALPFDRRRHGMLVGMGAAGIVVESVEAARERGRHPDLRGARHRHRQLSASTERGSTSTTSAASWRSVVQEAESRGVRRSEIARQMVFISHETYTPARGGSAAAEIHALRRRVRRRRRRDRDRQRQGLHRPSDGRRPRGRARGEGRSRPGSSRRSPTSETRTRSSASSTSHTAAPTRSRTRCGWLPASARRSAMTLLRWTPALRRSA